MNTAIDSDDGNPVLREMASAAIRGWRGRLVKIVEEGVKRGEIREGTEPRRIANSMIAALEGALMISRLEGSKRALQDARTTLDEMLDGIRVARAQ